MEQLKLYRIDIKSTFTTARPYKSYLAVKDTDGDFVRTAVIIRAYAWVKSKEEVVKIAHSLYEYNKVLSITEVVDHEQLYEARKELTDTFKKDIICY